jgi:AbrB family looped-hinge helix DNA binding protein
VKARVTTNGRITIPKRLRDALGLHAGSKLKFEQNANGEIRLLRHVAGADREPDRFEPFHATGELRALLRDDD